MSATEPACFSATNPVKWFAEHVHPHEPDLRAYLARHFPTLRDHDDLVQETYSRLLRLEDPDRLRNARAFLFRTARNTAIDLIRRRRDALHDPVDEIVALPLLETPGSLIESLERRQRRELLAEAFRSLPERCREIMLLRHVDGLSAREIAARLGLALGTVKCHLLKGLRDCSRFFAERGLLEADTATPEEKET